MSEEELRRIAPGADQCIVSTGLLLPVLGPSTSPMVPLFPLAHTQQPFDIEVAQELYGIPYSGLGSALASGDVNGDGRIDLIVGAYTHPTPNFPEGAVFLYMGRSGGVEVAPSWHVFNDGIAADGLGLAVACADFNSDGYTDIAYSTSDDTISQNCVAMHLGGLGGPSPFPTWTLCSPLPSYGHGLAAIGDVNGDGFQDLAVSAGFNAYSPGTVHIYLGATEGLTPAPALELCGTAFYGLCVSGGDVNGDGYSDVLIGSLMETVTLPEQGMIALYLGAASGLNSTPVWQMLGEEANEWLGAGVCAGDVNADGYSDIIVSSFSGGSGGTGTLRLLFGANETSDIVVAQAVMARPNTYGIGFPVSMPGDLNGDRFCDALVGSSCAVPLRHAGHVGLFASAASQPFLELQWESYGNQIDALYGESICGIGDINDDGLSDFAVGAKGYDLDFENEGRVLLYRSARKPKATRSRSALGPATPIDW